MKNSILLFIIYLSVFNCNAQIVSKHLLPRDYEENAITLDTLLKMAAAKHVKTFEKSKMIDGEHYVNSVASISKTGKIEYSRQGGLKGERIYYSYTDSTVALRRVKPDGRKYGISGNVLVTLELYDLKGHELSSYSRSCKPDKDTLMAPTDGWVNKLKNGVLKQRIYTNGDTAMYTYDKYGNLFEVKDKKGIVTEKYRRVYVGNKLTESYYSTNYAGEKVVEKFEYNALGLMVKSTIYVFGDYYIKEGSWTTYEYDAAKRVSVEVASTGVVSNYYYDSKSRIIKNEYTLNSKAYSSHLTYNDKGLLISYGGKDDASTFTYTYWE